MSLDFWKKLSILVGLMAIAMIFGVTIFMANLEIKDLDLWLHIGTGRYIVENGFVPSQDVLSCTIAGKDWVNHEWLFQVLIYWIDKFWGPDGLIFMQVLLVTVTMAVLLLLGYNNEKQLGVIFCLLLVSLIYHGRFTIRPDLYSLLFFALFIYIMSLCLDRRWSVWALFGIQVLWANMHGFFFFGPLFVMIGLFAEWLKRHAPLPYEWNHSGRLTNEEYRRLKWILVAVVAACLLNPLTFQGAWYPIGVFMQISGESKIFFDKIVELKRPITQGNIFSLEPYPYYRLLILLSFISFVYNRRKLDIGVLVFWIVFLVFSLSAVRNLVFFAFAAYLVFVTNALSISLRDIVPIRITDKKFIHLTAIFIKGFLIVWMLQFISDASLNGYYDFDKYERKSEFGGVSQRIYPQKAADFLVDNKVKGNFFNDFNSGAYLVGRTSPDIKVFIDGRTEVYGPAFFKFYQSIWEKDNDEEFAKAMEKYRITGVFFSSVHSHIPKNDLNYMYRNPDWSVVYFDFDGVIFLKNIPEHQAVIDKHKIDLAQWKAKELNLYRLGAAQVVAYQNTNRAYTLDALGLDGPALAEAQAAVKVNPSHHEPYKMIGAIYGRQKEYQKAFENFRLAALFATHDQKIRENMAQALFDLNEYEHAVSQYQRVIEMWPGDPKNYFLLARAYAHDGKYEDAVKTVRQGFRMNPHAVEDMMMLGNFLIEKNQRKPAQEVFSALSEAKKEDAAVLRRLGDVYEALGDRESARELNERILNLSTQNQAVSNGVQPGN